MMTGLPKKNRTAAVVALGVIKTKSSAEKNANLCKKKGKGKVLLLGRANYINMTNDFFVGERIIKSSSMLLCKVRRLPKTQETSGSDVNKHFARHHNARTRDELCCISYNNSWTH